MDRYRDAVNSDLLAVVPALNEEASVGDVVASIRAELGADVLVVDDGSTDATAQRALAAGATVVRHPFNLGVGAAMRTGFCHADRHGYKVLVQIDADGQHPPGEVAPLVEMVRRGDAGGPVSVAVGSRFAGGSGDPYEVSALRRAAMRMLSRSVSRRLGTTITDTTSGMRAFGPDAIDRFAVSYPTAYLSDTVEALLLAGAWGMRVVEVGVEMRPRETGVPSNRSVRSAYHLLRLMFVISVFGVRRPLQRTGL